MDQLRGLLQQYVGGDENAPQDPSQVEQHYDQVAQAAPKDALAQGISSAMRSDATPEFPQIISQLFGQSNNHQKAGILNRLLGSVNPGMISQVLSGAGLSDLAGALGGGQQPQVTPEQASQVPAPVAGQVAAHAQQQNPSIVDMASQFYSEHPQLVKSLGQKALSVVMGAIGNRV